LDPGGLYLCKTMDGHWWCYILVFLGAFLFDVVPFPFLPAFTIMIFLQITYDLNLWLVIFIGVAGSILGRYLLSLYIPKLSDKYFKSDKNKDVQFLGQKMREKGWKGQVAIVVYSLLPLPTTPLFVAGGMARLRPVQIIPAFFVGKFTSDTVAVSTGKFASENIDKLRGEVISWQTATGLGLSLILLLALLFIDWRTLLQKKKLTLRFDIFN
jgi:membrane protein DedA with SNARE-associated domain